MESPESSPSPISFCDFPEDVHVSVLSFLEPAEIAAFSCTSRRFASLCAHERLWLCMCERRWGSKTSIRRWVEGGKQKGSYYLLYKSLNRWENIIGFWRRIGRRGDWGGSSLVYFAWESGFITGSLVSQSNESGSYEVVKVPFIWLGLSTRGELMCFSRPTRLFESSSYSALNSGLLDSDLLPATIGFIGQNHFVVEEKLCCHSSEDFSNSEESAFVQRFIDCERNTVIGKRRNSKGSDATGKRFEAEHFVKIINCFPTLERPIQGIWKGICESMRLAFYLVAYDTTGAISCRRIGDLSESLSGYLPIFWTSRSALVEFPFTREEENIYRGREHIRSSSLDSSEFERNLSQIFRTNSSYDLAVVDSSGSTVNYQNVEGRVWLYDTGTFGFGFLRNTYIVDLTHITSSWSG